MRQIYNHFSMSQTHLSARVFLLPIVLLTLISFSGTVSLVSAQTTAEVCRGTKEVMEQLKREKQEVTDLAYFKGREYEMNNSLKRLNEAIKMGNLLGFGYLQSLADEMKMTLPKEVAKMTVLEREASQKQVRNRIVQKLQEVSDVTLDDLDLKSERLTLQLKDRQERYTALKCEEVLRNRNQTTGACTLEGTWTHDTKVIGSTVWRIKPDGTAKESGKGNADGTATLSGRTLKIDWKTGNGYSGAYTWELDESCNSGSGNLTFKTGTTGTYKSDVTRQ